MTGGQWVHLIGDAVVAFMAGSGFGWGLQQRRVNRELLRLIFEHMGGDIIEIAASVSTIDPTLMSRLARRAIRRAEEVAKR